jgi:cytochrome P450
VTVTSRTGTCPYGDGTPAAAPTVNFDSHAPDLAPDPFQTLARIQATGPVCWSPEWDGFWVATGHTEVVTASRDKNYLAGYVRQDGAFQGIGIPTLGQTGRLIPSELNVPECLKYRKLLSGFYSPNQISARMPEFRALATQYVDEIVGLGGCDLVQALTMRLPAVVAMRDIGLAEDKWPRLCSVVDEALRCGPRDPAGYRNHGQAACMEILDEMDERRGRAGAGLISMLLASTIDGEPVPDEAIVSMMYLQLLGIHPTSALAATALWYLAGHPDLKIRLTADPSLIPGAVEEFLRWTCPIQSTVRTAADDIELGGQRITAGERIFLSWAAANRDETVFPDADSVDIERDTTGHMSFGGGPHFCLGASTVRALCVATLEVVLARIPDFELADETTVSWFPDVSFVYGVTRLPVVFEPRSPNGVRGGNHQTHAPMSEDDLAGGNQ